MKKVLFATTALIATAGVAAADVSFGGFGYAGVTNGSSTTTASQSVRLWLNASVETDNGVTFSAYQRVVNPNNYGYVKASSGGASITVGSTHGAIRKHARVAAFHGYNNGGIGYFDNAPGADTQNDGGDNVYFNYAAGDLSLGLSTTSAEVGGTRVIEYGVSYAMNNVSVGFGANDGDFWAAKVTAKFGDVSVGVGTNEQDRTSMTVDMPLTAATTGSFAYQDSSAGDRYGFQVSHDLGGGVSLIANVQNDEADDKTSGLGVYFSF